MNRPRDSSASSAISGAADDGVELAMRIQAGDRAAEVKLVQTFGRGISYLLRRLTNNPELSKDLYQETFLVVLKSLRRGGLEDPTKLNAFVRGTARNLVRSEWRKHQRRGPHDDIDGLPLEDPRPGQWDQALAAQDRESVYRLLREMSSERDRQILYRHYLAEESKSDICQQLDIAEEQFNLVLFRARGRFRQMLGREEKRRGFSIIRGFREKK